MSRLATSPRLSIVWLRSIPRGRQAHVSARISYLQGGLPFSTSSMRLTLTGPGRTRQPRRSVLVFSLGFSFSSICYGKNFGLRFYRPVGSVCNSFRFCLDKDSFVRHRFTGISPQKRLPACGCRRGLLYASRPLPQDPLRTFQRKAPFLPDGPSGLDTTKSSAG